MQDRKTEQRLSHRFNIVISEPGQEVVHHFAKDVIKASMIIANHLTAQIAIHERGSLNYLSLN